MNNSDPVNDLRKSIPTLTEENYPEWRLRISIYLRQKKLLTYCNNPITPALDTAKPTKSGSDDLDASNEACALITSTLDSRTFAKLVNEETSQNSHELWRRINKQFSPSSFNSKARVWRDIILAFTILTKLPEDFQPLIEKITLKAKQRTQNGLKRQSTIKPERRTREACSNFTFAQALLTQKENKLTTTSLVLDTGASNHMFKDKCFFSSIKPCSTKILTGCSSLSLKEEAIGTTRITDRQGKTWNLRNSLYIPALTKNLLSLTNLATSETRIKKCKAWIQVPPQLHTHKFAPVSWEGIFLGYENNGSSYRILRSQDQAVVISRHVFFDKKTFLLISSHDVTTFSPDLRSLFPYFNRNCKEPNAMTPSESSTEQLEQPTKEVEDQESSSKTLQLQPSRIRVIGPRHPTLISSNIDTSNILSYRRRPRTSSLKSSSLQTLISFAASNHYQFHQMEVKSAFLNSLIEDNIAIEVPQGLALNKTSHVLQLNKALYGLKQSPLAWHNHLSKWLKSVNFSQSVSDPCVFWKSDPDPIWIYVHVDNLALFGPNLDSFKKLIQEHFKMKDLGEANLLLGITIHHLQNRFSLSQAHYINEIAEAFNISKITPSNTPLKPHLQLLPASSDEIKELKDTGINYRSAVGSLNYISSNTRPDITFAVSHLSQFLENSGILVWKACLQVLQYLFHTRHLSLHFHRQANNQIISYANVDWGNNPVDRRSVSGYVVSRNHHLISWRSKRQSTVSHSTTEAKYKALSDVTKETMWLRNFCKEINLPLVDKPIILNDNKGAIDLALCKANHNSFMTKRMDIKLHYIRELLQDNTIKLQHFSTHKMIADFLTKAVGKTALRNSCLALNLLPNPTCSFPDSTSQGGVLGLRSTAPD
ncbi:hypothetical protein O181_007776 [Austropuccinia psidii MF-1]|uniref:Reverse transcriptase Ty1/copia-type domain-containing protein n=1 Tax=Austropuccinia psidii MF-1 TaxID=1389203 RepID=A0A9Q3BLG1_9BASI|nr:hypothetical protein [Austropuccinia psidii MF-1]